MVTEWNTEAAALIIDEAVKGDPPFGTQVKQQRRRHLQHLNFSCTAFMVDVLGNTVGGSVVDAVLPVTPVQRRPIQVGDVPEHTTDQEALLDEPDKPFDLSLGKGMPRLAELCLEAQCFHKGLVVLLPDRMALKVPVEDHTFHIVR